MKNIYILNSCNEWKEYSSMKLVAATTSLYKLKSVIIHEIKEGNMEYTRSGKDLPVKEQVKSFKADWAVHDLEVILNHLEYGYVQTVGDGEIQ